MRPDVSALILAGGKATRLGGVDKSTLVVEGRTIFARQVAALSPSVAEILVSAPHDVAGFRCVRDAVADAGPLAGIGAGLAAATTPWLLVLAGDMPWVTPALVERLLAETAERVDAVGIRIDGLPEPLVCVLRVAACRPVVEARLARGALRASRLLADGEVRVAWLDADAIRAVDPALRVLFNVNVPEDL